MSPLLKARVSGAWVTTGETGLYRNSGAWVPFGPSGDPYETIAWPLPPDDTHELDGTQAYLMGVRFTVLTTQDCAGVEWRVPDSVAAGVPGTDFGVALHDMGGTRLKEAVFTPVAGTLQRVLFAAAATLTAADYIASVYTRDYVYSTDGAAGFETPSENVIAVSGRLIPFNGGFATAPVPSDNTTLIFHVSPLMVV